MAGAFDAKVDISTAEAVAGLQALRAEAKNLGPDMAILDDILKKTNVSLKEAATEFTALVAAQRAAAAGSKELAAAKILEARENAIVSASADKSAESNAKVALTEANVTRVTNLTTDAIARKAVAETAASDKAEAAAAKTAAAAAAAEAAQNKMNGSLANSRYLMYDVGATYGLLAAGLMAIPAATAAVAAAYQKDFAQVLRITGQTTEQSATLMQGIKDLGTQIPLSFKDMTDIAQMGAHLQLGNEGLVQFTDTVAKFSATTGVATDTAASMFSKMKTMFVDDAEAAGPDYFNRMGSSIAEMGTKIVATDQQVTSMVTSVQAVTASAGLSTQATIGLSGAMASLSIQPEMARGALTRMFAAFNRDSADATGKMQKFGDVIGLSGTQAAALWKSDPNAFFTQLVGGLNKAYTSGQNLTTIFDDLGIKNVRDINTLQRLAVGYDVLTKSQAAAAQGYKDGTALNDLSKPVFETVVAKLQEMANAWMALGDTLGHGPLLAAAASLITTFTNMATTIDHLVQHVPALGVLLQMLLAFSAVTAIFMAIKGAQALMMAAMLGFQEAAAKGMGTGLGMSNMMKTFAQSMLMAKGATEQQTQALIGQTGAVRALGIGMMTSSSSIKTLTTTTAEGEAASVSFGSKIKGVGSGLIGLAGGPIGIAIGALALLAGAFFNSQQEAEAAGKAIADAMSQGAEQGQRAIAEQLNNRKVQFSPTEGDISFSKLGQSVTEVARQVDVKFADIVNAVSGGTIAAVQFQKKMQELQKGAGGDKIKSDAYDWLGRVAVEMSGASKTAADGIKDVNAVAPDLAKNLAKIPDPAEEAATAVDKLDKALKGLNDTVFGTIDKQADLGSALEKLGEGLQKSGTFNNSEDGRANLKNLEDSLKVAQEYYETLYKTHQISASQASAGYAGAVDQILGSVKANGGDLGPIDDLAHQTVSEFKKIVGGDTEGALAPTVAVGATVDAAQAAAAGTAAGKTAGDAIQAWISGHQENDFKVGANTDNASEKVDSLAKSLATITGLPYQVILDALTDPANDKAKALQEVITQVANGTYKATVDADTTAAQQQVKDFVEFTKHEMSAAQRLVNNVAASAPGLAKFIVPGVKPDFSGVPYAATGSTTTSQATSAAPKTDPATQALLDQIDALNQVNNGYQKQQLAAQKAGAAGKKAGKDTAEGWQDAYNSIDKATSLADEYASRLKQGLDRAFEKQYGLTTATDAYYTALNAVNQKRADEVKQVADLTDKIKALNNERDKELITANKAKIEQSISLKYGEGTRAADYGNQATTALDNASSKQKEINGDIVDRKTIQDGIGLLTGYSDAAIKNRADLRDLETKQLDMVVAYAKTGASVDQVRAYTQKLDAQFRSDVGQIGFNQAAVQNLEGDLGRYIDVINRIPYYKPTVVTADTSQAQDELAKIGNDYQKTKNDLQTPIEINMRANWDWNVKQLAGVLPGNNSPTWASIANVMGVDQGSGPVKVNYAGGPIQGFDSGGLVPGTPPSSPHQDNMFAKVDGKGMISVRSREFIQPEPAVNYYGLDFMEAVRTLKLPKFAMSSAGGSSGGGGGGSLPAIVGLDAHTLAFLASIKQDVKLYTENRLIAESANAGNREFAAEGRN